MKNQSPVNSVNVTSLDAYVRYNRHFYDAFIYGFQHEHSLSSEIAMALSATIEMKMLFFLTTHRINNAIDIDITMEVEKFLRAEIPNTVDISIDFQLFKYLRREIFNCITPSIAITIRSIVQLPNLPMGMTVGSERGINIGLVRLMRISDIHNRMISEIQDLQLDDIRLIRIQ